MEKKNKIITVLSCCLALCMLFSIGLIVNTINTIEDIEADTLFISDYSLALYYSAYNDQSTLDFELITEGCLIYDITINRTNDYKDFFSVKSTAYIQETIDILHDTCEWINGRTNTMPEQLWYDEEV